MRGAPQEADEAVTQHLLLIQLDAHPDVHTSDSPDIGYGMCLFILYFRHTEQIARAGQSNVVWSRRLPLNEGDPQLEHV